MKQTLFRDGIVERLPQLIGDGNPPAQPFSVQDNMLENFKRVCSCLIGNSGTGLVMAGLEVTVTPSQVTIAPGYGITSGADIIKLAASWNHSVGALVPNQKQYLYLNYRIIDRLDANGGHSSYLNRTQNLVGIVRDVIGADSSDFSTGQTNPITVVSSQSQSPSQLFMGTLQTDPTGSFITFVSSGLASEAIDYSLSYQFKSKLWNTAGTALWGTLSTDSRMVLAPGRKRLHKLNVMMLSPSTSVARTDVNQLINLSLSVFAVDGSLITSTPYKQQLSDSVNNYFMQSFTPDLILDSSAVMIQISPSITATSPSFIAASGIDPGGTGNCQIEYVIEQLN